MREGKKVSFHNPDLLCYTKVEFANADKFTSLLVYYAGGLITSVKITVMRELNKSWATQSWPNVIPRYNLLMQASALVYCTGD
jgi:hypothetical protein